MYLDVNFRGLRISGSTAEGGPVIAGLFPVVNSEGVALDMLLELFHEPAHHIGEDPHRARGDRGFGVRGRVTR